jgi:hypothetical protein
MNQITIRGIPADVERAIRQESEASQLSLNKTIINMLKSAIETVEKKGPQKRKLNHNFDKYFGGWTKEEADEFDRFIKEEFDQIDEEMWK